MSENTSTKRKRVSSIAMLIYLALWSSTISAADWNQWRGPTRNGLVERSPSLINAFTGESPLWQSEPIPSGERGGRSSLVIHDGKVYGLTTSNPTGNGFTKVFCLER